MKLWHVEYTITEDEKLFEGQSEFVVTAKTIGEALTKAANTLELRATSMPDGQIIAIEKIEYMRGFEIIE